MVGDRSPERRPLVVVRADTRKSELHTAAAGTTRGRRPDFYALRDALDGRIVDENDIAASRLCRAVRSVAGTYAALAVAAFRQRATASAYVTGSENEAIVLAFLLKVARVRIPLVAVSIYPAKPMKWPAWRWARVHTHMSRVMALGSAQLERLRNGLGVPPEKLELLPYGVDSEFWSAESVQPRTEGRPYLFAAGLQHRDYPTLVAAADGLGVPLVVAAFSLWSSSEDRMRATEQPDWVTVSALDYDQLRSAYAGAAAVVVPLVETDFPAGTTSIVEAMSMGRPVVVARAEGTGDYVSDRRAALRRGPLRSTSAGFSARLVNLETRGQTGFFYAPGDVEDLRSILRWVLDHPQEADEIGARARHVVEELHTLEHFVGRIVAAVQAALKENGTSPD